jgi:hypothetical protein
MDNPISDRNVIRKIISAATKWDGNEKALPVESCPP